MKQQLQPPLISTLVISCLTIIPVLLLTMPLNLAQRKMYDPRIALFLDDFAMLFWLASFAALASYHHIFRTWGGNIDEVNNYNEAVWIIGWRNCWSCRKAWRTGGAATVFAGVEL